MGAIEFRRYQINVNEQGLEQIAMQPGDIDRVTNGDLRGKIASLATVEDEPFEMLSVIGAQFAMTLANEENTYETEPTAGKVGSFANKIVEPGKLSGASESDYAESIRQELLATEPL